MESKFRSEGYAVALEGAPIYYRIVGAEKPRLTIVLNDGIGCDGFVWKYLERFLSADYRLVHWHLPGHGRSPVSRSRRVAKSHVVSCRRLGRRGDDAQHSDRKSVG